MLVLQPTAANSAESLDSLPHSDCESIQPELEEVKPEVTFFIEAGGNFFCLLKPEVTFFVLFFIEAGCSFCKRM